ncbi:hypothetical protein FHU39_000082 [Flexivirga oryzae]|uniref:Uncharacterized protein n=1 Tax=Flexivirga oryzae TaxID=1794944 RepID=A0A839MXJ2_9MICO|nr:hypothetical protein [Flexivirga oryzae]
MDQAALQALLASLAGSSSVNPLTVIWDPVSR